MKALIRIFLASLLIFPLWAQESSPILGTTPTEWPGVHYDVARLIRLDAESILIAVRLRGDSSVKNPTFICEADNSTAEDPDNITPLNLTKAYLVDQASGQKYAADSTLPSTPYWGDPDIITSMRPNTWLQLAVKLKAPTPLPPAPDGKPQEQKVSLYLPKSKAPITDILLPTQPATSNSSRTNQ